MILKFGKYRECDIRDVPADYLEWLLGQTRSTVREIEAELERRIAVEEADMGWIDRVITAGYRELAKRHHPDYGGSTQDMQELNAAVEALREKRRLNGSR